MVKKHILIVPGDGIGQEVTAVGKKVLEKIASKFGHEFTYDDSLILEAAAGQRTNRLYANCDVKGENAVFFQGLLK